ncbi:ADP-ribosyltransferase [Erwinia amylovora]|uniref:ADP-ribosyltransferase n=1 Tax=Erwinia amylovora TaxID=552 RepID=UPI001443A572|nr:ADP-ribosyltransferase [Erwinia amylovora]
MQCQLSELSNPCTFSSINVVSDCPEDKDTPQSSREGLSANIISVSRAANEILASGHQRWYQSRQQGLRRPAWRILGINSDKSDDNDTQLHKVCVEGGELQRLAEDCSRACMEARVQQTPVFKLCGKSGWLAGAALATFSIGVFGCSRYAFGAGGASRPATNMSENLLLSPTSVGTASTQPEPLPIAAGIWAAEMASPSEITQANDVQIAKLDFSCLDERQTLTLADIFRQIGNTLLNPVEELAKEVQVIDYYNSLGRCPDGDEIKFLSSVTSKVDQVVSALISMIPGVMPAVIIQRVGGSLFRIFADDLEGKPIDFYNVLAINEQVMMMAKMIADFSPKDENGQLINNAFSLPENTGLEAGHVTVWIGNAKYRITNKHGAFLAHGKSGEFPVNYSYKDKSWYLVENEKKLLSLAISPAVKAHQLAFAYSNRIDFEIADTLKDVLPLNARLFRVSRPNGQGIYRYFRKKKEVVLAVKLNGKFYRVCSGTTKQRMSFYDKPASEIIMFDKTWYLAPDDKSVEVKSVSCTVKRSPPSLCMSYSEDLDKILADNHDYGVNPLEITWLRSDANNPAILVSAKNNKKYIQHNGVLFRVKLVSTTSSGSAGSREVRIYGKKRLGFLKRKTKFNIAIGYFSESKGNSFLYSKIESVMESLYLPRPTAEAYQAVKDFERKNGEITADEYESIRAYGGVRYREINDFIYNGRLNDYADAELKATVVADIENIRGLLKKLPSIDGVVYRGSQLNTHGVDALNDLKAEDIISSRKFISASMDPVIANAFAAGPNAVRYTIYVRKAAHPILTFTGKLREAEVLIEDNTVFRCVYIYGRDVVLEELVNPSGYDLRRLKHLYI